MRHECNLRVLRGHGVRWHVGRLPAGILDRHSDYFAIFAVEMVAGVYDDSLAL